MTTATLPIAPTRPAPPRIRESPSAITIISHSNVYYWWPVWACGFVMAVITWAEGYVMAVVPQSAVAYVNATTGEFETSAKNEKGEVVTTPHEIKEPSLVIKAPQADDASHRGVPLQENGQAENPFIRISPHRALGVIFVLVLLLVVAATNVSIRGMWSVARHRRGRGDDHRVHRAGLDGNLARLVLAARRPHQHGWLLHDLDLPVRAVAGGHAFVRQAARHHLHGGSVQGMRRDRRRRAGLQHGRHDVAEAAERLFPPLRPRPGFGRPDRADVRRPAHQIDLPNVLFINYKLRQIETLLKTKNVVAVG